MNFAVPINKIIPRTRVSLRPNAGDHGMRSPSGTYRRMRVLDGYITTDKEERLGSRHDKESSVIVIQDPVIAPVIRHLLRGVGLGRE